MIINVHVKCPLLLLDFRGTYIFSTDFRKINTEFYGKSVNSKPSYSLQTDRQTDMAKLIVSFSNFANAPEKGYKYMVREMLGAYHGHESLCSNG
jgi:hypothetical protein